MKSYTFLLCVLFYLCAAQQLAAAEDRGRSIENLRVSNNQFNGNYDNITPDRRSFKQSRKVEANDDVGNHIGIPLVQASMRQGTREPQVNYNRGPANSYQVTQSSYVEPDPSKVAWEAADKQRQLQTQWQGTKVPKYVYTTAGPTSPGKLWKWVTVVPTTSKPRQPTPPDDPTAAPAVTVGPTSESSHKNQSTATTVASVVENPANADDSPTKTCSWMPVRVFQNISLDLGEVIIRDATDQPCYILTVRAFLRWNDTAQNASSALKYFPLKNFKSNQLGYKLMLLNGNQQDVLSDDTDPLVRERLLLNCTLPAAAAESHGHHSVSSISLLPSHRTIRMFKEEITIRVDCGYLVLQVYGDNSHLSLKSLSFYQNAELLEQQTVNASAASVGGQSGPAVADGLATVAAVTPATGVKMAAKSSLAQRIKTNSMMQSEHLVFSSEGTHPAPLLTMPLVSRYTCQNRIVLTGKNSIQLVLDRFELQRLTHHLNQQKPAVKQQQQRQIRLQDVPDDDADDDLQDLQIEFANATTANKQHLVGADTLSPASEFTDRGAWQTTTDSPTPIGKPADRNRWPRDTTILYKNPLIAVTQCPSPDTPTSPLTSMMDLNMSRGNDTSDMTTASRRGAEKNAAAAQGAAGREGPLVSAFIAGLLGYVVTLYLTGHIL